MAKSKQADVKAWPSTRNLLCYFLSLSLHGIANDPRHLPVLKEGSHNLNEGEIKAEFQGVANSIISGMSPQQMESLYKEFYMHDSGYWHNFLHENMPEFAERFTTPPTYDNE